MNPINESEADQATPAPEGAPDNRLNSRAGRGPGRWRLMILLPVAAAFTLLFMRPGADSDAFPRLPRGDIAIDAAVAHSLAAGDGFWTPWERGSSYRPPDDSSRFGHYADQHPPLWPLAGALLMDAFGMEPLDALEAASFLAHIAALMLMVWLGARMKLGRLAFLPPLLYTLLAAGSAFSLNGSLYTAQAGLYLLAACLMGRRNAGPGNSVALGLVLAAAYLLNYQAVLLLPAFLAVRLICLGRSMFRPGNLALTALVIAVFSAAVAPWLIRNTGLFNDPIYSVNRFYAMAKAGAPLSQSVVNGRMIVEVAPFPLIKTAKGLAGCAWFNIPYLLLLLLVLFPGCAAIVAADIPDLKKRILSKSRDPLVAAVAVVLLFHLAACLLWPALKLRYIVPAAPLIILLAWKQALGNPLTMKWWTIWTTLAVGALCIAVRLKGSVHGEALFMAFLLCYLPMSLGRIAGSSRITILFLVVLCLTGAGAWPGSAYFNIQPCPDFFGQDKETIERESAEELHRISAFLNDSRPGVPIIGDIRLWHTDHSLRVIEPPKAFPGDDYGRALQTVSSCYSASIAVLGRREAASLEGAAGMKIIWEGGHMKVFELNP